jgi:hypothetical protein
MQYDVHKLTVDQIAEEVQEVLENSEDSQGWMSLREIAEALDLEDDVEGVALVKQTLRWMLDRSMVQRTHFGPPKLYRMARL